MWHFCTRQYDSLHEANREYHMFVGTNKQFSITNRIFFARSVKEIEEHYEEQEDGSFVLVKLASDKNLGYMVHIKDEQMLLLGSNYSTLVARWAGGHKLRQDFAKEDLAASNNFYMGTDNVEIAYVGSKGYFDILSRIDPLAVKWDLEYTDYAYDKIGDYITPSKMERANSVAAQRKRHVKQLKQPTSPSRKRKRSEPEHGTPTRKKKKKSSVLPELLSQATNGRT